MKIQTKDVDSFLLKPPENIAICLIFGRDKGLVQERAEKLTKAIVTDVNDPFLTANLSGSELKNDPARLIDEATTLPLGAPRRAIRIRLGGEDLSKSLKELLSKHPLPSLVIIEAENLTKTSALRKLLERNPNSAVISCYEDNRAALANLISSTLENANKYLTNDAREYLLTHLGSDRMVSKRELEKLLLYVGTEDHISLDDVGAVVSDSGPLSIEKIVFEVASGKKSELDNSLSRAYGEGIHILNILRATQEHMRRLRMGKAACLEGKPVNEVAKLYLPTFLFMYNSQFNRQLEAWTPQFIESALKILIDAEILCKSTGMPQRSIGERALFRVAQFYKTK
ncbi:MAG: DNA polymerase III subunit delta [Pseudomonadota bacterium]|nr:DNA polymerase III subunit delta [Pseudomonadota bacterium]